MRLFFIFYVVSPGSLLPETCVSVPLGEGEYPLDPERAYYKARRLAEEEGYRLRPLQDRESEGWPLEARAHVSRNREGSGVPLGSDRFSWPCEEIPGKVPDYQEGL